MKFQLTFAALLAFVAAAAAASAGETAYPIESHDLGPEGTLTVYGIHGSEKRTLQARACGDQKVICSPKHAGTKSVCAALVNQVCDSDTALSKSPRSICLVQSGAQCCISWSADVGAISAKSLCPAARNTLSQCDNNVVSGLQRNTPLGGGCVTQCLSNRPDQCA